MANRKRQLNVPGVDDELAEAIHRAAHRAYRSKASWIREALRQAAASKNGFVVTVSTLALNVDSLISSLSGFDHQRGIRPHRIGDRALRGGLSDRNET
jgi:hypothetical protein